MKKIILLLFIVVSLYSQELKIKADRFDSDEKKGVSVFTGKVNITKSNDELNASKVTIYTDKDNNPTKFIAIGEVSFKINTQDGSLYKGKAQKTIYDPIKKEYYFYNNVYLMQVNEKKEIIGDEVVLKTVEGKAYAKGAKKEPVIMIFSIKDVKDKDKK
jgi:lipopolysaccharide export system protein LptA